MSEREQNAGRTGEQRCPYEDAAIATFLDGEPRVELTDASLPEIDLHAHIETCPVCKAAIETTRQLDALLASETRTDVDEATANRLLSVVAEATAHVEASSDRGPAPETHVDAARRLRLVRRLGPIALAASLLIGLAWVAWTLRADDPDAPRVTDPTAGANAVADATAPRETRTPKPITPSPRSVAPESNVPQPGKTVASAKPAPSASKPPSVTDVKPGRSPIVMPSTKRRGVSVPGRWSLGASRSERSDDEPLLSVLADDRAVSPNRVVERLERLFVAAPRDAHDDSVESRTMVASIRWLAEGVESGAVAPRHARLPVAALLRSRGALRDRLADAIRETRLWSAAVGEMRGRRLRRRVTAPDIERVALVGAIGIADYTDAFAGASIPVLEQCFAEARRTGDRQSMSFALHLFLAAAKRDRAPDRSVAWLSDLSTGAAHWLRVAIDRVLMSDCSPFEQDVCTALIGGPDPHGASLASARGSSDT